MHKQVIRDNDKTRQQFQEWFALWNFDVLVKRFDIYCLPFKLYGLTLTCTVQQEVCVCVYVYESAYAFVIE